jgi:hypothetical protein
MRAAQDKIVDRLIKQNAISLGSFIVDVRGRRKNAFWCCFGGFS